MKARNRILATLLFAVMIVSLSLFTVSCKAKDSGTSESESTSVEEVSETKTATYYCDAAGVENEISFVGNTYVFSIAGEHKTGSFTLKSGEMKLSVDGAEVAASISGDELAITYGGKSYVFLEKIGRTVTYAGADAASETVVNGKTATKPEDPASTTENRFIGWYTSADYTEVFNFAAPVRENVTVYARFVTVQPGQEEFTATLYNGSEKVASVQTTGGKLYNLPVYGEQDGKAFDGWYVSDFNSADKPTSVYADQTLTQNVNLYATWKTGVSGVSVTESKIAWEAIGSGAQSFTVTVTDPAGQVSSQNVSTNEMKYDFAKAEAGEYTIVVTNRNGDETATVYYNNKALDRVSVFNVVEPAGMLTYNPVAGAEKYIVTVDCGNDAHNHAKYDNGTSTYFDISNCDMQKGGIKVTVRAEAKGRIASVSEAYYYDRTLEAVEGVRVTEEGEVVWFKTENALSYVVTVNGEEIEVGDATSYSLKYYGAGDYLVGVYPVTKGYNSPAATEINYKKTKIAAPDGVTVTGGTVTWNAVEGATGYTLRFNGNVVNVTEPTYTMTDEQLQNASSIEISVSAKGTSDAANSYYSDVCTVGRMTFGEVTYENGMVYWNPVYVAAGYRVQVNGEEPVTYEAGVTSAPVVFTQTGANPITVSYVFEDGVVGATKSVVVNAYAVVYNVTGGNQIETAYIAVGDKIPAPEAVSVGYDFGGWYDVPSGGVNNGKKFTESTLTRNADVQLYAYFTPKIYTVTFETGNLGTIEQSTATVVYEKLYDLPVAVSDNDVKVFAGWYSEPNGAGMQFTDFEGTGLGVWTIVGDVTVYAYWVDIFSYELDGSGKGYIVSSGLGISYVKSAKIPEKYEGLPVTAINILTDVTSLVSVSIPNTASIVTGTEQGASTSSFQNCGSLQSIEIYDAGEPTPRYVSEDGVIYAVTYDENDVINSKKLYIVPLGKRGEFTVAEGTTEIGNYAMYRSKVEKVVIPYTVTKVGEKAMSSCTYLTDVEFLAEPEDVEALPLEFGPGVFYTTSKIVSMTLPSRLAESYFEETDKSGNVTRQLHFDPTTLSSCTLLETIEIVGHTKGYYSAVDGMLCTADGTEIIYCPRGRTTPVTIGGTVSVVQEEAFKSCSKITELTVTGGVKYIGKNAFASCSGITTLTFLGDETDEALTIGERAFYSCSGLLAVELPENLVSLSSFAFGSTTKLTTVTVKSTGMATKTVDFGDSAFGTQPTTVGGTSTFYVKNLTIGAKVPQFSVAAVFGNKVENLTVEDGNENYAVRNNVLYDKDMKILIFCPLSVAGQFNVPDTVETISAGVFRSNTSITGVLIPASVTTIGKDAFNGCNKITQIVFEKGDKELVIGENAFRSCSSLTSIVVPGRATTVGPYAFGSCSKVVSIVVEEGVKVIGDYAFASCGSLVEISFPSTLEKMGEYDDGGKLVSFAVFNYCSKIESISVAEGNENFATVDGVLYIKNEGVIDELAICPALNGGTDGVITVPNTVTKVWDKAFYNNKAVAKVVFEQSDELTREVSFGIQMFYGAINLTEVVLPEGLDVIAEYTFYNTAVRSLVIPSTVTSIEPRAFYTRTLVSVTFAETREGAEVKNLELKDCITSSSSYGANYYGVFFSCDGLTEIAFPERTTYIGTRALASGDKTTSSGAGSYGYPSKIKKLTLPSTLNSIGEYAFGHLYQLTEVVFAENIAITEFPGYCFAYDESLQNISVPAGVTVFGPSSFSRTALKQIDIPEGVTELGYNAFAYTPLTSVFIPKTVVRLGGPSSSSSTIYGSTFYYCSELTEVVFEEGSELEYIYSSAFYQCKKLSDIVIPDGVLKIDNSAFQYTAITSVTIPATVTEIGTTAFGYCTSLKEVNFAEGSALTKINNYAFRNTVLESFAFPETSASKLTLGTNLFYGVQTLKTVHLSSDVSALDNVFTGCTSIEGFTIDEGNQNFSVKEDENILYNKDQTAVRFLFGENSGTVLIPEGTTEISDRAFAGQASMTKVILPSTIRTIGKYAFLNCWNLQDVVFNEGCPSLTEIKDYTFQYCIALKNIDLPSKVTKIGQYAFSNCISLESFTLGGTTDIGNYVFQGTTSLVNANLPATLKTIGNYVFQKSGLKTITIPKTVTKLGNYVFESSELTTITFESGSALTSFGTYVFKASKLQKITIPEKVTTLGNYIFQNCYELEEVKFDGVKVTAIPQYCFQNCSALKTVELPSSVKTINTYAFDACTSLETFEFPAAITDVKGYVFRGCTALKRIEIPAKITILSEYLFQNCTSLSEVVFPNTLKRIGTVGSTSATSTTADKGYVFAGCTSLTSVEFPESLEFIAPRSFQNTGLVTVTLPKNLKYLTARTQLLSAGSASFGNVSRTTAATDTSSYAAGQFQDCANLREVILPAGLEALGARAFYNCPNLTRIVYEGYYGQDSALPASLKEIAGSAFQGCAITSLYVSSLTTAYNYAFAACDTLETIVFDAGCAFKAIPDYAFAYSDALTSVRLSEKIEKVGKYAFAYDGKLETVILPDCVETIASYAFRETALANFVLPSSVTTIETYAFTETNITEIDLSNVTVLGNSVFANCDLLEKVVLNGTLESIPTGLFFSCNSLKDMNLPATVTSFGTDSFVGTAFESFTIPASVSTLGINVFSGMNKLKAFTVEAGNDAFHEIDGCLYDSDGKLIAVPQGKEFENGTFVFPETVTSFASWMFNGNTTITTLDLSKLAVTELPDHAFNYCNNLEKVILPDTLEVISQYAFSHCYKLKEVNIPASLKGIEAYAFEYSGLETFTLPYIEDLAVGNYVFRYSDLQSVTIAEGYTAIPNYTFQYCESLTEVNLPESLEWIGSYAFAYCSALESIDVPANVVNLCDVTASSLTTSTTGYVFYNNTALKEVNFLGNKVKLIGSNAFNGTESLETVVLPSSLEILGNYAFDKSGIRNVTINGGFVGTYTFRNTTRIETVTIGEGVTNIPDYAFQNAATLTTVNLPSTLKSTGKNVFQGCTALESITLPEGMETVGSYAFDSTGLKSVVIPASVTKVDTYAFQNTALETVTVLSQDITFGMKTFYNCVSLKEVNLPEHFTQVTLGTYFLSGCTSLTSFDIPEELETLPSYALQNTAITSIVIPESVTKVDSMAFDGCVNLNSVTLGSRLETIGANAFKNCTAITSIVIPRSVVSVLGSAFSGWTSAQTINIVGRPFDVAQIWNNAWATGCEAKIVWEYKEA